LVCFVIEHFPPQPDTSISLKADSSILSPFMQACRQKPSQYTPIWLMRQAGRYMPEYQEIRAKVSFLDLCKDSDLATHVTVSTVERLGVDAAIIFADILLILEPLGVGLEFVQGDGPQIGKPVRTAKDVELLPEVDGEESLQFVFETVKKSRAALNKDVGLIGFAGAPFTLASYLIEGGPSKNFALTKKFMYSETTAWHSLLDKLATATIAYLRQQAVAGADALQLFDSWVGCLSVSDYEKYVLPHSQKVLRAISKLVPTIHFGVGAGSLLPLMKEAGGNIIGLDWRVDLALEWQRLGPSVGVQGNLDPIVLLSDRGEIEAAAARILRQAGARPGHIFNLGHGILPSTPVDNVLYLIDTVHRLSAR
jgi:uroporphyrinogen decarboxylase